MGGIFSANRFWKAAAQFKVVEHENSIQLGNGAVY
jgi:hypothetical protein